MEASIIAAARALLPADSIYADWAASALPLPLTTLPCFIPPAHTAPHPDLDNARRALQAFLQDIRDRYHVIFTSGATAALRILADRLPWSSRDAFFCHAHVHNAVLGIRNPALAAGAQFRSLCSDQLESELQGRKHPADGHTDVVFGPASGMPFALLAYSGECNLTGTTYPFNWARTAREQGIFCYRPHQVITLLDTAKLAASAPFCLDDHSDYLDAVVFSLYKLSSCFTGLGALLVRKDSLLEVLLRATAPRSYFAGGRSVDAVSPFSSALFIPSEDLPQQLELGTPNLQAIHHLSSQLSFFSPSFKVMANIHRHTTSIAASFSRKLLSAFSPENVKIHRDLTLPHAGMGSSVVAFTLYRTEWPSGVRSAIGHNEVATVLRINNVYARAGCMCNTGACCAVLGLSDANVAENYAQGHRCGDDMDLVHGKPTGVVRISFGWASLPQDADSIVQILRNHICASVQREISDVACLARKSSQRFVVDSLYVYPIKSCGGASVEELFCEGHGGALGDRAFAIEDIGSKRLTNLRSCPELASLSARYTEFGRRLILEFRSSNLPEGLCTQKSVDLSTNAFVAVGDRPCKNRPSPKEEQNHCTTPDVLWTRSAIGGSEISEWLSAITGKSVRLVRRAPREGRCENVGDVLIVSKEEMQTLKSESGIGSVSSLRAALRPNIVLELAREETDMQPSPKSLVDAFSSFQSDEVSMMVRRGCTRCAVVNIVLRAMGVDLRGEPLRSIARLSRQNGQKGLVFGALASCIDRGVDSSLNPSSTSQRPIVVGQEVLGIFKDVHIECGSELEQSKHGSGYGTIACRRIHSNDPKSDSAYVAH